MMEESKKRQRRILGIFRNARVALLAMPIVTIWLITSVLGLLGVYFPSASRWTNPETALMFGTLAVMMVLLDFTLPKPVTKKDIVAMAEELQTQMDRLNRDNQQLRDQLAGVTPSDETFARILNDTIDYLQKSPETEIVSIRGYLLYIYRGNSERIKQSIRTLSPNSPKITSINIFGGQNQILPNAEKAVSNA